MWSGKELRASWLTSAFDILFPPLSTNSTLFPLLAHYKLETSSKLQHPEFRTSFTKINPIFVPRQKSKWSDLCFKAEIKNKHKESLRMASDSNIERNTAAKRKLEKSFGNGVWKWLRKSRLCVDLLENHFRDESRYSLRKQSANPSESWFSNRTK